MCGLFGSVFDDSAVDVDAALASLAHRGPDARGVHRAAGVVLGHTRLAILDLTEAAGQPMTSRESSVTVVFNGEIYNHHALRAELESLGHSFRSRSDTEVIVEGYRAWGDGIVERLDGMFAIGIFDAPKRRLLLARDRTGKKPLFYTMKGGAVRFASEIKALVASGIRGEVDVDSLPMLLSLGYTAPPRSMYRGIEPVPPGSMLTLVEGETTPRVRRYWRSPFVAPRLEISEREAEEEVFRLVDAAVKRRLESDVPLGAFLSAGIDSTVVVGLMARHMTEKLKTFSIGFQDPRFDETALARDTARVFGTDHTEFILEPASFDVVQRLVELHDGPFGDSSAVPTSVVSMLTRRHVTVALSGDGGDELFCGYPRFLAVEASERIPRSIRSFGARVSDHLPGGPTDAASLSRVKRFLSRAAEPLPKRLVGYCSYFAFELGALLRPELRRRPSLGDAMAFNERIVADFATAKPLPRILAHTFETYLPYDLLVKADRASMMHSLEVRSPFLDTALIEFAARLPSRFLRLRPLTKRILKRAFRDLIPPAILAQPKRGFGMPVGSWFRGDLKDYLLDHFSPEARMWEYLDRPYVEAILEDHFAGKRDEGHRLWLLLTLEIWLRSLARRAMN